MANEHCEGKLLKADQEVETKGRSQGQDTLSDHALSDLSFLIRLHLQTHEIFKGHFGYIHHTISKKLCLCHYS